MIYSTATIPVNPAGEAPLTRAQAWAGLVMKARDARLFLPPGRQEQGEGELLPVGKAYFGFTDEELMWLDRFVRNNTVQRFGPVREVEKSLVLEVAFDSIHKSTRHKSGLAMRFPRISRIRTDKPAHEADRIALAREVPDLRDREIDLFGMACLQKQQVQTQRTARLGKVRDRVRLSRISRIAPDRVARISVARTRIFAASIAARRRQL